MLAIMSEFTTLIYHSTWFISFFYSIRLEFQLNFHVSRTPDWNIFTSGFIGEWKHSKKLFEYSCLRKRIYFYVACCCTPNIFRVGLLAMLERKDSSHVLLWSRKVQSLSFSFLFYKFSLWEILSIGFSIKYLFEIPPEPFSIPGGWKFIMFLFALSIHISTADQQFFEAIGANLDFMLSPNLLQIISGVFCEVEIHGGRARMWVDIN